MLLPAPLQPHVTVMEAVWPPELAVAMVRVETGASPSHVT